MELARSLLPDSSNYSQSYSFLKDRLELLFKLLAQKQGGPDCTKETAPRHLLTVLSQLGQEKLETVSFDDRIARHGGWLADDLNEDITKACKTSQINAFVLTASVSPSYAPFLPGTVYKITDTSRLKEVFGYSVEQLQHDCFNGKLEREQDKARFADFQKKTKAVLVEVSPACDFHQGKRRSAMLIAGLICPADIKGQAQGKDAFKQTPVFEDSSSKPVSDVVLVLCSHYRLIMNHAAHPDWLHPWLRLRDILMADIRNWQANQAARIGFFSL